MFVQIIRNAETQHGYGTQYWWTGLRDPDDDHIWIWAGSKNHFKTYIFSQSYYYSWGERIANFTLWHPVAKPDEKDYNCMKLLPGTNYNGLWLTSQCNQNFSFSRPVCQLVWINMLTSTAKFLWAAQTMKGTACKLMELHASSWKLRNCM